MSAAPTFILASASPARLSVLRAAGIEPVVKVSGVDEDAVAATLPAGSTPETVVVALAKAKAGSVAAELSAGLDGVCWLAGAREATGDYIGASEATGDYIGASAFNCVIVGCDSLLHIDGELQGKPLTAESARRRWTTMAGRSGDLLTGHCVLRVVDGQITATAAACSSTTVHFGTPATADLDAYLESGEPLQVAGAFTLDGLGGWFVDRIDGDPSSVIGIGLPLLRGLLAEVGVGIAQLWGR